ncbi:MAG: ROK family transcriptional regulator [Anaerolineaceae bacterium]
MNSYLLPAPTTFVKNINKYAILDLIRFTPGGISRVELARKVGLTRAAVTSIVNDLLAVGVIREAESRYAPSGRRPVVLEINAGRGKVIGIDMGATHVTILLADFSACVLRELESPFDINDGPEECLFQVDSLLRDFLDKADVKLEDILAIGVGVPGPIVSDAGMVSGPPIMPGWDSYPIRDHLQELWQCPVALSNDAELGALGEWAYGAGRGERNLAYIKVGTGIGCGLLLDGRLYRGTTGSAGEIGHITLTENGPLCTCGNRGCLEALAGGNAIARRAQEVVRSGHRTQMASITPINSLTARDVIAAARSGDLTAQNIVAEAGEHLGTAIASVVNLFNPSMIVVGGGVAQIGDLLLEPIRKTVRERSLKVASRAVRITAALLGRRSAGMGAVVQALTIALHQIAEGKEVKVHSEEVEG